MMREPHHTADHYKRAPRGAWVDLVLVLLAVLVVLTLVAQCAPQAPPGREQRCTGFHPMCEQPVPSAKPDDVSG